MKAFDLSASGGLGQVSGAKTPFKIIKLRRLGGFDKVPGKVHK